MAFSFAVDALNLVADRRGMGRFARTVLRGLGKMTDFDVSLVVRDPRHVEPLHDDFGFPVVTLREAGRAHFDAVWYPWNGVRFEPRVRKVVTIHDAFAFTNAHHNLVARLREQGPIRRAVRVADELTSVSRWSAGEIAGVFRIDAGRFTIVNPVPDTFWHPVPFEKPAGPFILFVAGPDERKNAPFLFHAFRQAFPDREARLIVAGALREADGDALARAGIAHERARPTDHDLRTLYCSALAVAIPSLAEGYGIMAVEAMACGAAVVAADAAALPETCAGAALLADPRDLDAWTTALRRVAGDDSLRADLQRRSLERAARIDRGNPARAIAALARRVALSAR